MNEVERLRHNLRLAIEGTGLTPDEFAQESGIDAWRIKQMLAEVDMPNTRRMGMIRKVLDTARRQAADAKGGE